MHARQQEAQTAGGISILTCTLRHLAWMFIFTGAQPKAGTGHKMQSISVVFQRYIVRDISLTWDIAGSLLLGVLAGSLKSYPPFWKARGHGGQSTEWCIGFGGTTRSPAFTTHKFMSENSRVNIWRDNFTSDYVRVNLPSRNLSRI